MTALSPASGPTAGKSDRGHAGHYRVARAQARRGSPAPGERRGSGRRPEGPLDFLFDAVGARMTHMQPPGCTIMFSGEVGNRNSHRGFNYSGPGIIPLFGSFQFPRAPNAQATEEMVGRILQPKHKHGRISRHDVRERPQ